MNKGKWLDELDDTLSKLEAVTAERDRLHEAATAALMHMLGYTNPTAPQRRVTDMLRNVVLPEAGDE